MAKKNKARKAPAKKQEIIQPAAERFETGCYSRLRGFYPLYIIATFILIYLFISGASPTITFYDSPEFTTILSIFGVGHPSGYPFYTMAGRLLYLTQLGSPGFRAALFSALAGLLTLLVLFLTAKKALAVEYVEVPEKSPHGGEAVKRYGFLFPLFIILAVFIFAFSRSFWIYSEVAEAYALNVLFLALALYAFICWREAKDAGRGRYRYIYLAAFLSGLGVGNHMTLVLYAAVIFLLFAVSEIKDAVSASRGDKVKPATAGLFAKRAVYAAVCLFFAAGLSAYLYLPLRSMRNPLVDWGNPETLKNFIWMFRGEEFEYQMFTLPAGEIPRQLYVFTGELARQFTPAGLVIGAVGFITLFMKKRLLSWLLFLVFCVNVIFNLFIPMDQLPAHFFIPAYFIFTLYIIGGFNFLAVLLIKRVSSGAMKRPLADSAAALIVTAAIIVPVLLYAQNRPLSDKSGYYFAYDYGINLLENTRPGALVVTKSSTNAFLVWYMQHVEKKRQDITPVYYMLSCFPWYIDEMSSKYGGFFSESAEGLKSIIARNKDRKLACENVVEAVIDGNIGRDIYIPADDNLSEHSFYRKYSLLDNGIMRKLSTKAGQPLPIDYEILTRGLGEGSLDERASIKIENYSGAYNTNGVYYFLNNDFEKASYEFKKAIELSPDNSEALYNYAYSLYSMKDYGGAVKYFSAVMSKNPSNYNACFNAARAYYSLGKTAESVRLFEKCLRMDSTDKRAGWIRENLPKLREGAASAAVPDAATVMAAGQQEGSSPAGAAKEDLAALEKLIEDGNRYFKVKEYEKAIAEYEKFLAVEPDSHEALNKLGVCYYFLGLHERAESYYRKALKLSPDFPDALNNLGLALFAMKKFEPAVECWEKVIALQKDYSDAYRNLGVAYNKRQDFKKAREVLEQYLVYQPDDMSIRDFVKLLDKKLQYEKK